jgi:hypothetical protein
MLARVHVSHRQENPVTTLGGAVAVVQPVHVDRDTRAARGPKAANTVSASTVSVAPSLVAPGKAPLPCHGQSPERCRISAVEEFVEHVRRAFREPTRS